jgi:hypothetical protein
LQDDLAAVREGIEDIGMSRRADHDIEAAADCWAEHRSPAQAAR